MARPDPSLEELELELLLTAVARRFGYDFRHYARASLVRRVRNVLDKERLPTLSALQEAVLHDPAATARFVDAIAVHTTSMFRDADFYRALRVEVIPLLRTYPFLRIWHAGCSTGEEVYSLAILLEEAGLYDRCRVYATDLSEPALERARAGIYPLKLMRDYTVAYQRSGGADAFSKYYMARDGLAVFSRTLTRNVVFSQHNLASDAAFNEFHLILCRNVMIYFDDELRRRAHELFHQSLGKFGLLALGRKESIRFTPYEAEYVELGPGTRIYRRGQ